MNVMDAIKERRSVRSYQDKDIPEDVLGEVLDAVRLAPSARNKQDWKFITVRDKNLRQKLVGVANNQQFVGEAPVVIAAVALDPDYVMSCQVPAYAVDLAIALDHLTLAAVEKGLGTCWIGAFDQEQAKKLLAVLDKYKIVALMPLGYPADNPGAKNRKDFSEVVCYDQFS